MTDHCRLHWQPLPCIFCQHDIEQRTAQMREALQRIADGNFAVHHKVAASDCDCARCIAIAALAAADKLDEDSNEE